MHATTNKLINLRLKRSIANRCFPFIFYQVSWTSYATRSEYTFADGKRQEKNKSKSSGRYEKFGWKSLYLFVSDSFDIITITFMNEIPSDNSSDVLQGRMPGKQNKSGQLSWAQVAWTQTPSQNQGKILLYIPSEKWNIMTSVYRITWFLLTLCGNNTENMPHAHTHIWLLLLLLLSYGYGSSKLSYNNRENRRRWRWKVVFLTISVLKINLKISISFYTIAFRIVLLALDNLHFTRNWHSQTAKW